ncbi:MAG: hydrogenase formation protein HypD [Bacteroidota bacterium]
MIRYIDEYRNKDMVKLLLGKIRSLSKTNVRFMEVCGGHTMAIQKFGIPSLLPDNIELVSGPGCPVCVTAIDFIDKAVALAERKDVIICTFGDLIRVPGSTRTLNEMKANGSDVRIVLSPLEPLKIAKSHPEKKVVFLGIGFETTSPGTALAVKQAWHDNLMNYYVLSAHKIMPPAMRALVTEGINIQGFLAPGHVSSITGTGIYRFIAKEFGIPVSVSGFEPVDILQAVCSLVSMVEMNQPEVKNDYNRAVRQEGNKKAQQVLDEVFTFKDDWWRGLGVIPASGFELKEEYQQFDAERALNIQPEPSQEPKGCICGDVLKGLKKPQECKLFARICQPETPVGACMVSNEGACQAAYRYQKI